VTERQHEVALTHEEVNEILQKCGHGALLVGGQALAFWAAYYDVEPVGELSKNRLRNLETLSSKRDATGIAQAELSIVVAGKFVSAMVDSRGEKRTVLAAVERIARIALDKGLVAVAVDYGIDPLAAVPASRIDSPEFWTRRWPQIQTEVTELRRKHAQRAARRPPARTARAPR